MIEISKKVGQFWNRNLCGKEFIKEKYPSKEFFDEYRSFRYKKEHHLNYFIDWQSAKDSDLLEIGTGVGADSTRWAKYAKSFTGIDLTEEAVSATDRHLKLLGLKGSIVKSDTELLPFKDNSFDIVYSHGVLHHVPSIENSLKEIGRVLRSDGRIILMLYSKDSFNYWFRIQCYFRLRFVFELLKHNLDFRIVDPWKIHIKNYKDAGLSYFSWKNWYHHCTDGPDCEIANIYQSWEIVDLLKNAGFNIKSMRKAHFPIGGKYPALEHRLAKYIGFYHFVWANKA